MKIDIDEMKLLKSGEILIPEHRNDDFQRCYISSTEKFIIYFSYGSSAVKTSLYNLEWIKKNIFHCKKLKIYKKTDSIK